jgi:hypothetical protein
MYNTELGAKPLQRNGETIYCADCNFVAKHVHKEFRCHAAPAHFRRCQPITASTCIFVDAGAADKSLFTVDAPMDESLRIALADAARRLSLRRSLISRMRCEARLHTSSSCLY